jgi:hypothetical protein
MRKVKQIKGNKMTVGGGVIKYRTKRGVEVTRGVSEYDFDGTPAILEAVQNLADNAREGVILAQMFDNWLREMAGMEPQKVVDPWALYNVQFKRRRGR